MGSGNSHIASVAPAVGADLVKEGDGHLILEEDVKSENFDDFTDFDVSQFSSKFADAEDDVGKFIFKVGDPGDDEEKITKEAHHVYEQNDYGAKGLPPIVRPSAKSVGSQGGGAKGVGAFERVVSGNKDIKAIRETHSGLHATLVNDPSLEALENELIAKNKLDETSIREAHARARKKQLLQGDDTLRFAIYLYTTDKKQIKTKKGDGYKIYDNLNQSLVNGGNEWQELATHILRGLKLLPYEWGTVYRGSKIYGDVYTVGNTLVWSAFTSTSKCKRAAYYFALQHKNKGEEAVLFTIKSYSGRFIKELSHFPKEDEVLIPPMTLFRVEHRELNPDNGLLLVTLRECHIAKGEKILLWVDDEHMNNKALMEQTESLRKDVNLVMLNSTEEAIGFLQKEENEAIRTYDLDRFRVITDMTREGDHEAGAKFILELRDTIGYDHAVMVFCQDLEKAAQKLLKYRSQNGRGKTILTNQMGQCLAFTTFDDVK